MQDPIIDMLIQSVGSKLDETRKAIVTSIYHPALDALIEEAKAANLPSYAAFVDAKEQIAKVDGFIKVFRRGDLVNVTQRTTTTNLKTIRSAVIAVLEMRNPKPQTLDEIMSDARIHFGTDIKKKSLEQCLYSLKQYKKVVSAGWGFYALPSDSV